MLINQLKQFSVYMIIFCLTTTFSLPLAAKQNTTPITTIAINETSLPLSKPLPVVKGEVLVPLRWIAEKMGATTVSWDSKQHTVSLEIPTLILQRQYLSYLAGLTVSPNDSHEPLPSRLNGLNLPPYPLHSGNSVSLHNNPLTLTMMDKGYSMPYALYDYELIDHTLYVSANWLNTLFLAEVSADPHTGILKITYPTESMVKEKVAHLEQLTMPQSPEEALSLWIRGQQSRSGALQYTTLSPSLKEKVIEQMETGTGSWVTGGSSPSLGAVTITPGSPTDGISQTYTLTFNEMLQGTISGQISQTVVVTPTTLEGKTYWLITDVTGDLSYYSILAPKE